MDVSLDDYIGKNQPNLRNTSKNHGANQPSFKVSLGSFDARSKIKGPGNDARTKIKGTQNTVKDARQKIIGPTGFDARSKIKVKDARLKISGKVNPNDARQKINANKAPLKKPQPKQFMQPGGTKVLVTGVGQRMLAHGNESGVLATSASLFKTITSDLSSGQDVQVQWDQEPYSQADDPSNQDWTDEINPGFESYPIEQFHDQESIHTMSMQPPHKKLLITTTNKQVVKSKPKITPIKFNEEVLAHPGPVRKVPPGIAQIKKQAGKSGVVRTSAASGLNTSSNLQQGSQRLTIRMKNNLRTQSAPVPKRVVPGAASQSLRRTTQPQTTKTHVSPRVPVHQEIEEDYNEPYVEEDYNEPYVEEEEEYEEEHGGEESVYEEPPPPAPTPPRPVVKAREALKRPRQRSPAPQTAPKREKSVVLLSNLHPAVTREDLFELFSSVGSLEKVEMTKPRVAEITFHEKEYAMVAIRKYHMRELDGFPMCLTLASAFSADDLTSNTRTIADRASKATVVSQTPPKKNPVESSQPDLKSIRRTAENDLTQIRRTTENPEVQRRIAQAKSQHASPPVKQVKQVSEPMRLPKPEDITGGLNTGESESVKNAVAKLCHDSGPLRLGKEDPIFPKKGDNIVEASLVHRALFKTSGKSDIPSKPVSFTVKI